MSAAEAVVNTVVGYLISLAATATVLPAFGVPVGAGQAVGISAAFTALSVVRSYVLRRIFNRVGKHERI